MNPLKVKLLDYLNHRANRKSLNLRHNTSFKEAREFGILFTWAGQSSYLQIREIIKSLEVHGKEITSLCYVPSRKIQPGEDTPVFYDRDISWLGKSRSEAVSTFLSRPFDFLLHLDLRPNIMTRYILARSRSRCRVGRNEPENHEYYEMMIHPADASDYKDLCEQILHYTKSIVTYV